jgi:hypothetical protein
MARKLAIDDQAVAHAVINQLLAEDEIAPAFDNADTITVAEHLIDAADIEYLPRARRLTLSFDLSGEPGPEPDLDEPIPLVPAPPAGD